MVCLFLDGFDKYGVPGQNFPTIQTLLQQEWTTANSSGISIVTGLSSTGYALNFNTGGSTLITKTLATSYSRLIGGLRLQVGPIGQAYYWYFTDSASAQCTISVTTAGNFAVSNGVGGTVLGTSTASITSSSIHYVEWDITFGASASYTVWLDGVSILTGTGNTKTTGNSSANGLSFGNANNNYTIDDLYLFDSTGTTNNAVLLTSPRIETRYPSADSQTQWTNGGNLLVPTGIAQTGVGNVTNTNSQPGSNVLVLIQVKPSVNCNLQSVSLLPNSTNAGANIKAVLYSDSANVPGSLLATGTQVTGVTTSVTTTLPFASGQTLIAGTPYWIGMITDTSFAIFEYDTITNKARIIANTYTSGAPSPAPVMTINQPSWMFWGNATGAATNFESLDQLPPSGVAGTGGAADNGSINSTTVGNEDLYTYPALRTSVTAVYAIGLKANIKKSDTGARTVDLRLKSSATDSAGSVSGQTPGTSYGWMDTYFDQDPNGPTGWTVSAANAATAGPKVAS